MVLNVSILIGAFVALFAAIVNMRNHRVDYLDKQSQNKKKNIANQLEQFYVPIIGYLQVSRALSKKLFIGKPKGFNILTYLLDQEYLFGEAEGRKVKVTLSDQEMAIVGKIILLSKEIANHIIKHSGSVEDKRLTVNYHPDPRITNITLENTEIGLLGLLLSHYRILEYAYNKTISGNVEYYDKFKFPREIEKIINENYLELVNELEKDVDNYISIKQFLISFCD